MKNKPVRFVPHALEKIDVLRDHGIMLDRAQIEHIVRFPDRREAGYDQRLIAQGTLDARRIL